MSEVVRLYQHKSLLVGRRAMPAEGLMARLKIYRATLKRGVADLRDRPSTASPARVMARRIRIMHAGARVVKAKAFEAVTAATKAVSDKTIKETVNVGYGIFNNAHNAWATVSAGAGALGVQGGLEPAAGDPY
jgi:hypothetical protein